MGRPSMYAQQNTFSSSLSNRNSSALSIRSATTSGLKAKSKKSKAKVRTMPTTTELNFIPDAEDAEDNGWQKSCEDVKARVFKLFNNYTMCDVVFSIQGHKLPGHSFILSIASPVLYQQLYETDAFSVMSRASVQTPLGWSQSFLEDIPGMETTMGPVTTVEITHVDHLAFFEFLRYIYTDDVNLTLSNVMDILFLAESYKVAGLADKCFEYLRAGVAPRNVFKILTNLKSLLVKTAMLIWTGVMENKKAMQRFREMSLVDRRAKLAELDSELGSPMSGVSGRGSTRGSMARQSMFSGGSRRASSSMKSRRSSVSRSSMWSEKSFQAIYRDSEDEDGLNDWTDGDFDGEPSVMATRQRAALVGKGIGEMMPPVFVLRYSSDLHSKCWQCIQEETESVLASNEDLWNQELSVLRQILALEICNVKEISMFRAMCEWAERCCKKVGIPRTGENFRRVLGVDCVNLIRFPTMSLDEFQWEVVPACILRYVDVQQLLYTISARAPHLGAGLPYDGKPRSNMTLKESSKEFNRVRMLKRGQILDNDDDDDLNAFGEHRPLSRSSSPNRAKFAVYAPVSGDEIDSMLGAELLRVWLEARGQTQIHQRKKADDFLAELDTLGHAVDGHSAGFRDGPLRSPSAAAQIRGSHVASSRPSCRSSASGSVAGISIGPVGLGGLRTESSILPRIGPLVTPAPGPVPPTPRTAPGRMQSLRRLDTKTNLHTGNEQDVCMGQRFELPMASNRAQANAESTGKSERPSEWRRPTSEDFERLAVGVYQFRGDCLVEMWLEHGSIMVKDHGPRRAPPPPTDDVDELREMLGWDPHPPRGQGVTLTSFLCRQ